MGKPVYLDRKARARAVEVDDVRSDRMLTAEFEASLFAAQALPKQTLGQGHLTAKLAGGMNYGALRGPRAPSTALRAVPLPVPGRNWDAPAHAVHPSYSAAQRSASLAM